MNRSRAGDIVDQRRQRRNTFPYRKSPDHADYENFLTFVRPLRVEVGYKRLKPRHDLFDASETVVLNSGANIDNQS